MIRVGLARTVTATDHGGDKLEVQSIDNCSVDDDNACIVYVTADEVHLTRPELRVLGNLLIEWADFEDPVGDSMTEG